MGFQKDVFPLLLRKFSRDLDEGVSNLGQRGQMKWANKKDLSREILEFFSFNMVVNAVYILLLHHVDSSGRI